MTGEITVQVTGEITGQMTGQVTGQVTGEFTGHVTGQMTATVTRLVTEEMTGKPRLHVHVFSASPRTQNIQIDFKPAGYMQRVNLLCMKLTRNLDCSSDQSQTIKMFQVTYSRLYQEVVHMPASEHVDA